jgi:predicted ATPase with chaperone activity
MFNWIVETADDADVLLKQLAGQAELSEGARVLIVGANSSGKTALARRIASAMPAPNGRTALEAAWMHHGTGLSDRPTPAFRAPHHTCSTIGLTGGGWPVRPGEVSLAHGGTLFLDDISEFRRDALSAVAHALRHGEVKVYRRQEWSTFPARPACVIATTTECPCGRAAAYEVSAYRGGLACTCNPKLIAPFMARAFGGPLGSLWTTVAFLRWNREEAAKFLVDSALQRGLTNEELARAQGFSGGLHSRRNGSTT